MDGDEFGNGYTTSTKIGTTSACFNLPSYLGSSAFQNFSAWDLWSQFESPFSSNWSTNIWFENAFPTNWSTDWLGVNAEGQSLQGLQGQSGCLPFSAVSCWIVVSGLAWLVWGQPAKKKISSTRKGKTSLAVSRVEWDFLPTDIQERVIGKLPYENVHQLKAVSKSLRDCIERDSFLSLHDEFNYENVTLTAPYFYIKDGVWQCAGYDSSLKRWRRLPPLSYLPAFCNPDLDLFKEYLVCTRDGIICMNVSKSSTVEKLIVFNLLTGKWKELPPLNHRRNPVLMHLIVDASTQSYQVIVAGSSKSGDEHLSRMTEVFHSRTGKWKRTGDLPGPGYALNDYQTGIYKDGNLFCIAFLDQDSGKGILRYNLNKGIWLKNWTYPIPFSTNSTILQLVESWGEVFLFSEQVNEQSVEHCVDRVEWDIHGNGGVSGRLDNVVRSKKMGGRSLEIYPEYTCVPFSEHEVCVFNTIDHSGVVYDVWNNGRQSQVLQAPSAKGFSGECFFCLNPLSFTIEPSFKSKI